MGVMEASHELAGGVEVLLGEDLGGDHDGTLESHCGDGEEGSNGDHGLAAADFALEEAVHGGNAFGHVREDFVEAALLGAGEGEGKGIEEGLDGGVSIVNGSAAGVVLPLAAALEDGYLEEEKLVEGETSAGFLVDFVGLGEMGADDGFGKGHGLEADEGVRGEEFLDAWSPAPQGVPDDASEGAGVEVPGQGMDGQRANGIDEGAAFVDEVVFGVLHDWGAAEGADSAAEGDFSSGLELFCEVWLVEPDDGKVAGPIGYKGAGGGAAFMAEHGSRCLPDGGEDGCVFTGFEAGDSGASGVFLVVTGEVVEEVADGVDVEAGEFFGGLGVDALEVCHGIMEGIGVGRGWRLRQGNLRDEGAVDGRGGGAWLIGQGSTPIQTFLRQGEMAKRGGVKEFHAGCDPFGALVRGHAGVGTVE